MQKIYFCSLALMIILFSCKEKTSTTQSNTDSTKSGVGLTMPDLGTVKNNTNNGGSNIRNTGGNWSKEYRDKFLTGCITKASESVSTAQAVSYCNCMTEKVEAKYPNEAEVDASLSDADIAIMRPDCLSVGSTSNNSSNTPSDNSYNNSGSPVAGAKWSYSDQQEFMNNCVPGATKSLGTAASGYCECMMNKIMQEYPNSKDAGSIPKSHMTELAKACLR